MDTWMVNPGNIVYLRFLYEIEQKHFDGRLVINLSEPRAMLMLN